MTVSDGRTGKTFGTVTIDPSKSDIYQIKVADYVDDLNITFEHASAPSSSSKISMNAEIVKF